MNAHSTDMARMFAPGEADTRLLRDAYGRFATGVTIVTCDGADGPVCITANSFSSLSLDPPLVMWAVDRGSRRFPHFDRAGHFAVHVLSAEQGDLCQACARDAQALRRIEHGNGFGGAPLLADCLARFECERYSVHEAGDHVIVVGKVLRVGMGQGDALTFFAGKFGQVAQP
ncbi:flavin reductase family protein [Sulfitobacter sp. D35]|uniref:flavin reductase family protein n=1 Tax=Sulfitobacter sp. D35 TaxID=3083252 RepID=UPI00296F4A70|nr:flavin reductase family protein [Sulfitobacter sp. D35]MDW4498897.1 flavin reductase family protein [Sulfitobacter sp. D35]